MASLFTKIINGEIPGKIIHQDEQCFAIADIQPEAPKHFLIIPRKEIRSLDTATPEDEPVLGHLLVTAAEIARQQGIHQDGYRVVINTNKHAGQTVFHLHVHLLGGRQMSWPPG
jgi:histidine triad (HIT) family protein